MISVSLETLLHLTDIVISELRDTNSSTEGNLLQMSDVKKVSLKSGENNITDPVPLGSKLCPHLVFHFLNETLLNFTIVFREGYKLKQYTCLRILWNQDCI